MSEELTFCGTPLPDFIRLYEEQAESRIMSPDEEEVFSLVKAANDLQSRQPDKELVDALEKICGVSPADGYARCIEIADETLAKNKNK